MHARYVLPTSESAETLGVVELTSIAVGYAVADVMLKRAPITLRDVTPACPGKLLIICTGPVAAVQEAMESGVARAGGCLVGTASIYNLHPQVIPAIQHHVAQRDLSEAVALIETFSAPSAILAADAAAKTAEVTIHSVTLLDGIGGKAFALIGGGVPDVEAAAEAAVAAAGADALADVVVIPQVHSELVQYLPGVRDSPRRGGAE